MMTAKQWASRTFAVGHKRTPQLKQVDDALQAYTVQATSATLAALCVAVENWCASKRPAGRQTGGYGASKIIVIISDLHIGSSLGLCPTEGMNLGEGGNYKPSRLQSEVSRAWTDFFWYVESISQKAESTTLVVNGDSVDGFHHNTVALATNNIEVQEATTVAMLRPQVWKFDNFYMTRGTEAHVQASAQSEERIAKALNAIPNEDGQHSWWQLWLDVDGVIFNIAHHIGTTSSTAYESSAVMRELASALVEAGQWGQQMPDVLVRSHRHRYIEVGIPSAAGKIHAIVTPGWQLRTPFVERIDRMRLPHIGGVICKVEDGKCLIEPKIYPFQNISPLRV